MKKLKLNIKSEKTLHPREFAGMQWTNMFREKGADEVLIEVDGCDDLVLLDWNTPRQRYNNKEDSIVWDEYVKNKANDGWFFCASWGYGMFIKKK